MAEELPEVVVEAPRQSDPVKPPATGDAQPGKPSNLVPTGTKFSVSADDFQTFPDDDEEQARIMVRGRMFLEWISVWVQHRFPESTSLFRFTAAEPDDMPELWTQDRFRPGDDVTIWLGGRPAMFGIITDRQTAYDANNHQVLLVGVGTSFWAYRASVDDKSGKFDGMNFEQVARKCLQNHKINIKVIGKLDPKPYESLQCEVGEPIWEFLEKIARPKKILIGSDHLGSILLIGEHSGAQEGYLVEGHNILKCQCTISIKNAWSAYVARNQANTNDKRNGADANKQEQSVPGTAPRYSPKISPSFAPVSTPDELARQALSEYTWAEGTLFNANITTQGWINPMTNDLWRCGANVFVKSRMAMLNMPLKVKTATFTQDNDSGTLTTLELVDPRLLNDSQYKAGMGSMPDPPPPTQTREPPKPGEQPDPQKPGGGVRTDADADPWQPNPQESSEAAGSGGITFPE